jgi:hypothetical protein
MQPVVFAQSVTFLAQFISKHERYSYHFGFLTGDISRKEFYTETFKHQPRKMRWCWNEASNIAQANQRRRCANHLTVADADVNK